MLKTIGLFGGTFNPIHKGHIHSALELKQRLQLDELRLIPCHHPPHRELSGCENHQRLTMVRLAVADEPQLQVDEREMKRNSFSYTVDTLEQLRNELGGHVSLCWIMGTDAFAGLNHWHRWRELLNLAHIIVITRPGAALPSEGEVAELMRRHADDNPGMLHRCAAGSLQFESLQPWPVSATAIRQAICACYRDALDYGAVNQNASGHGAVRQGVVSQGASDHGAASQGVVNQVVPDYGVVNDSAVNNRAKSGQLCNDSFLRSVLSPPVLDYIQKHQLYASIKQ